MMKTVIIAVCSAGAYLALVIGLMAFCSYRLLLQRRNRKSIGINFVLTHFIRETPKKGNWQCSPRSDAAECGVCSGSTL